MIQATEVKDTFACFGAHCSVLLFGNDLGPEADEAVAVARRRLLSWHARFSRFDPGSELSRLNADPRTEVQVSSIMALFVDAAVHAAASTGGLVDPTLLDEIERAGYRSDLDTSLPLHDALRIAPPRRPARPRIEPGWLQVTVDRGARTVTRRPGLKLDSGGIAKGLFADLLSRELSAFQSFAVDCAGDVRLGGSAHLRRGVNVASPFDGTTLHTFELLGGGVATSGIGRRSWLDSDGRPAHHLLDPATGAPAFAGLVQVTALASTALEAETRAKAALLSGPDGAAQWLPHGGAIVHEDASCEVFPAGG